MNEKICEKYLGDMIHSGGNSASVLATVNDRLGKTTSYIIEARAIIEDCRINSVSGICAGLDIWELAYIPGLLNNCESWVDIEDSTIAKLDDLQETMYRTLLATPKSTPPPALCWDMGGLLMKFRIIQKKLIFIYHIIKLEQGSLAFKIQKIQQDLNFLCIFSKNV